MKKTLSVILTLFVCASLFVFSPLSADAAEVTHKAGRVTVSTRTLYVRTAPDKNASVIKSVYNGTHLTLLEKTGDWWKVEYADNKFGYCHADYITLIACETATVNVTSGYLNVRNGAGSDQKLIDVLYKGDTVLVLSESNGWSKVLFYGSKIGYVSSKYLKKTIKYSEIKLNVPSFKQTDSRWANVKLGSSGKTMGDIGCVTTSLAMAESYRTGTTIYPDAMAKKLKYTSSGSVYWPSNYTMVTSISSYLSKFYDILKSGRPVIVGLKNKYGGQHWVVVTGYKGGDTLKAANFTINDPGSKTRDDLQDFINAYPYFYKYLYY